MDSFLSCDDDFKKIILLQVRIYFITSVVHDSSTNDRISSLKMNEIWDGKNQLIYHKKKVQFNNN